jgi:hypothetical protein
MAGDCYVCTKHRALAVVPGGAVLADEHVVVSHTAQTPQSCSATVLLGHLLAEPRRHVTAREELSPAEQCLDRAAARHGDRPDPRAQPGRTTSRWWPAESRSTCSCTCCRAGTRAPWRGATPRT